jgi:hypothetical protein
MRSAHMPVEVLGLHVEREHVGEQRIQRTGDVSARIVPQIGGGDEGRLAAVLCSRFLGHGESLFTVTRNFLRWPPSRFGSFQ